MKNERSRLIIHFMGRLCFLVYFQDFRFYLHFFSVTLTGLVSPVSGDYWDAKGW